MSKPNTAGEPEITDFMLDEGERAICESVGGAELGGYFSARDLARSVYLAMVPRRKVKRGGLPIKNVLTVGK